MRRIKKVSDGSLIIQKEDSALFFHLDKGKEMFKVKEQFVTVDGYEESISFGLDVEELKALAAVVNHAVFQLENENFVAIGEQLASDIHFKAKNKEEAEQWAVKHVGWDVSVLAKKEWEEENKLSAK